MASWKESNSIPRNVVFDGNSLTFEGVYPSKVVADMYAIKKHTNASVAGQTTSGMITRGTSFVDPQYLPCYHNICVAWEGSNDLYFGASASTAYDRLSEYCRNRMAAKWRVVIVTLLPRSNSGTPPTFEASRDQVNSSILAGWGTFADAIADVSSDSRIGNAGDENDTLYYSDRVHLTAAGYHIVADIIEASIASLPEG